MIPIRLELQGLYSYREKQTIEFDKLTDAGLFGIFGAVGSGKSSILEGILLALYGSTERLSDRGEKNSMLNLQSEQLLINFEFRAGKNNTKTYLARYAAKRNPKNFDDVRPAEHTFYERAGDTWEPIPQRAEEIVGMKKEHFKQTVIIPQGKFKEFIDLTPGPRADMMKELFGLERFDLSPKTSSLLKAVRDEKIRQETLLQGLISFSKESLEEKEAQFQKLKQESDEADAKFKIVDQELRQQEAVRAKHQQLLQFRSTRKTLDEKRPEIEAKRLLHREFITAKTYLKPIWDQLTEATKDLEKYKTSVINCERFKERFAEEVSELEKEEEDLKKKNQERPLREGKIRDLKKVIEIQTLQQSLAEANRKLETLKPEIDSKKSEQKTLQTQIKQLEEEAEKTNTPDSTHLAELKSAERDWQLWEDQLAKLNSEFDQIRALGLAVRNQLDQILQAIPKEEKTIENWLSSQKSTIQSLESERDKLIQKQGLSAHVHLLHDGEACPLCGSQEHPNPIQAEMDEQELVGKALEISKAKTELDRILGLSQKQSELSIHLENHRKNAEAKRSEIGALSLRLSELKEKASKSNLDSRQAISAHILSITQASENLEKLRLDIKSFRKQLDDKRDDLEKAEESFNQAKLKSSSLESSIATKREEIKDPIFCQPFFTKDPEIIRQGIKNVEKDIEEAYQLLEGKQKHLREKRGEQVKNLADLENFSKLKQQTKTKLEKLQVDFEALKVEHGFRDEQALVRLFENSLDAEKVMKEITQFDQSLAIATIRIQELEAENGVSEFQEEAFLQLSEQLQALKSTAQDFQKQSLLLGEDIKESQLKLEEKNLLEKTFGLLLNRESYLKELDNLFRGSGFVKYVSSIYLKELCNTANIRFMKLSKNSLSLEIDDDNTFWVIDYLNGGKRRLLKTLSGGQTFQASLCLALALAEKVKALNQADQSFFFLDEGFGALDRNALRVVFETLKSLRYENRIVGIISHVEELQQEIGVYAQIELDPDRGSQVKYSF
jgi:exonuclease SbcC